MTTEEMVNELLNEIKTKLKQIDSRLDAEEVFLNGNCGNMYIMFAEYFFPKAVVPYMCSYKDEERHIITEIDGEFYDITGKTDLNKYIKYVQDNDKKNIYNAEDFSIKKIELHEREYKVGKRCNMYDYDDLFGESMISNQMFRLEQHFKAFKESKFKEER